MLCDTGLARASSGLRPGLQHDGRRTLTVQLAGQSGHGARPPLGPALFPFHFGSSSEKKPKVPLFRGGLETSGRLRAGLRPRLTS